jgi:hypothetical protein
VVFETTVGGGAGEGDSAAGCPDSVTSSEAFSCRGDSVEVSPSRSREGIARVLGDVHRLIPPGDAVRGEQVKEGGAVQAEQSGRAA